MKYKSVTQLESHDNTQCKYCQEKAKFLINDHIYCCQPKLHMCPTLKEKNSQGLKRAYKTGKRLPATHIYENLSEEMKKNMAWNRGKHFWDDSRITTNYTSDTLFSSGDPTKTLLRKTLLIEERGYRCEECGINSWQNKPITLELDHIDGDTKNNIKVNLKLLCPNCHSQTPTWKIGKSVKQKVSDEIFMEAIKTTPTIHQALIKIGLTPKGANYVRAKKLAALV